MNRSLSRQLLVLAVLTGAAPGQTLLADLEVGPQGTTAADFTTIDGAMLFVAGTSATGNEVWRTDGTPEGTAVLDLASGVASGIERGNGPYRLGKGALFFGTDGIRSGLFATDGTAGGTRFVDPVLVAGVNVPARFSKVAVRNGQAYFTVWDGSATGTAYRTDGTPAGTTALANVGGRSEGPVVAAGAQVFFTSLSSSGSQLWRTDGTSGGTAPVVTLPGGGVRSMAAVGNQVFFSEERAGTSYPVWVSDGTPGGTMKIAALPAGLALQVIGFRGAAMVLITFVTGNSELWRTDGTAPGTSRLAVLNTSNSFMAATSDLLYIVTGNPSTAQRLWRSDGTAAGTSFYWPPFRMRTARGMWPIGNRMLFGAWVGLGGYEPWVTDGTVAGTVQIAELNPTTSSFPWIFTLGADLPEGPSIVFAADDGTHGWEPWIIPVGSVGAAVVSAVQAGCATGTAPRLETTGGPPRVGNTAFSLRLRSSQPVATAGVLFSLTRGMPVLGCDALLMTPEILLTTTDLNGDASVALPVPPVPALVGARVYLQPATVVSGGAFLSLFELGQVSAVILGS